MCLDQHANTLYKWLCLGYDPVDWAPHMCPAMQMEAGSQNQLGELQRQVMQAEKQSREAREQAKEAKQRYMDLQAEHEQHLLMQSQMQTDMLRHKAQTDKEKDAQIENLEDQLDHFFGRNLDQCCFPKLKELKVQLEESLQLLATEDTRRFVPRFT